MNIDFLANFDLAIPLIGSKDIFKNIDEIAESADWFESNFKTISKFLDELPIEISKNLLSLGYDTTKYDEVKYYESPFHGVSWEALNIGVPNKLTILRSCLLSLKTYLLFQSLKADPADQEIRAELEVAKKNLEELVATQAYVD